MYVYGNNTNDADLRDFSRNGGQLHCAFCSWNIIPRAKNRKRKNCLALTRFWFWLNALGADVSLQTCCASSSRTSTRARVEFWVIYFFSVLFITRGNRRRKKNLKAGGMKINTKTTEGSERAPPLSWEHRCVVFSRSKHLLLQQTRTRGTRRRLLPRGMRRRWQWGGDREANPPTPLRGTYEQRAGRHTAQARTAKPVVGKRTCVCVPYYSSITNVVGPRQCCRLRDVKNLLDFTWRLLSVGDQREERQQQQYQRRRLRRTAGRGDRRRPWPARFPPHLGRKRRRVRAASENGW